MSKYSGIFLSFLLIFLCLWINFCRYPQVWVMVNGDGASEKSDLSPEDAEKTAPENVLPVSAPHEVTQKEEPEHSWVPKPVVVTTPIRHDVRDRKMAVAQADDDDDSDSETSLSGRNVSSGGKKPNYFKTANLSSEEESEETDESGISEDSEGDAMNVSLESPIEEESTGEAAGDSTSSEKNPGDGSEEGAEVHSVRADWEGVTIVQSPYRAAGSFGTEPLNFESPAYINQTSPHSYTRTNARAVERN